VEEVHMTKRVRRERTLTMNLRCTADERAKLHAIAAAADEPAAQVIRRFIRQRYAADFGEVPPARIGGRS
jgi:hypothetical protein